MEIVKVPGMTEKMIILKNVNTLIGHIEAIEKTANDSLVGYPYKDVKYLFDFFESHRNNIETLGHYIEMCSDLDIKQGE